MRSERNVDQLIRELDLEGRTITVERLVEEAGEVTEPVTRRACSYAMNAQEAGAEAVMLTSPATACAIDAVRASVRVPVVRIDEGTYAASHELGDGERSITFGTDAYVPAVKDWVAKGAASEHVQPRKGEHGEVVSCIDKQDIGCRWFDLIQQSNQVR